MYVVGIRSFVSWMMIALSNERRGKIYGFGNHFLKITPAFHWKKQQGFLMPRELAGDFESCEAPPGQIREILHVRKWSLPDSGWDRLAMWTRIWCVRPV